jgi:hypothetical protein
MPRAGRPKAGSSDPRARERSRQVGLGWARPREKPVKFSMIFEAQTHDTSRKVEFQLLHDVFLIQMGTVPQWAVLETIGNLGRRVIPHFRGRA